MGSPRHHILRVGVTGGIGSGKSLVCTMFSRAGIPILSADEIAKEIMRHDKTLRRELTRLLGLGAYRPDGDLDRGYIASRIFSHGALQRKVNALVHPKVETELDKSFLSLEQAGEKIAIVEAALIYEAGYEKHLDRVIVVDAPEEERIRRVAERDNTSRESVGLRIRAQLPPQQKLRKADFIIRNCGSTEDLEASVKFLVTILQQSIV